MPLAVKGRERTAKGLEGVPMAFCIRGRGFVGQRHALEVARPGAPRVPPGANLTEAARALRDFLWRVVLILSSRKK